MPLADPNISPDRVFDESSYTTQPAEALTLEFFRETIHPARLSRDPQQPAQPATGRTTSPSRSSARAKPWGHQHIINVPHPDTIPDGKTTVVTVEGLRGVGGTARRREKS